MSLQDSINAYHLFLGRQPESERVAGEKAELSIEKLAATFLGSREFTDRILPPLSNGYPLPHFRIGGFPSAEMLQWARQVFPLSPAAAKSVESARTWRDLLKALLTDNGFRRMLPPGISAALSVLDDRQPTQESGLREIVGAVEDFSTFEIKGWAADLLHPDQQLSLEIFLDNLFLGVAQTSLFRREVEEKLGGSGKAGFIFNIPAAHHSTLEFDRLLTIREAISGMPIAMPIRVRGGRSGAFDALINLRHEIEVVAKSVERIKAALPGMSASSEYPLAMYDAYQKASRTALMIDRQNQIADAAALPFAPSFSVVLSGEGDVTGAVHSINSLRRQTYRNWECIVAIPFSDPEASSTLGDLCSADNRVKSLACFSGMPRWKAMNEAIQVSKSDYVVWLAVGDLLSEDALYEMARLLQDTDSGLIYFDEDRFERQSGRARYLFPVLKTDFDHDYLLSTNYIGNAFACRRNLLDEIGSFRSEDLTGADEYDLLFRLIEKVGSDCVVHLPKILYHRQASLARESESETAARVACVNAHLQRTGAKAIAEPHTDPFGAPQRGCQRVVWALPEPAPTISIIIPTRDRTDLLEPCIESVLQSQNAYAGEFELILMDNESSEPETFEFFDRVSRRSCVRVLPFPGSFNWSAINNHAAREARGELLVFLNNDTKILSLDWARELASLAMRPDVGAVGARLLYEDGTIQHGGVILGGRAIHEGAGHLPAEGAYLGRTALQHSVSAVTGACLATRKDLFFELGGFDELNLKVAFNDVDYCLKVRAAGLSVIYTPFATLYHFESKSRGLDDDYSKRLRSQNEMRLMRARWGQAIENDPFYNTRFNRTGPPFTRLRPPQVIAAASEMSDDEQELWEAE